MLSAAQRILLDTTAVAANTYNVYYDQDGSGLGFSKVLIAQVTIVGSIADFGAHDFQMI